MTRASVTIFLLQAACGFAGTGWKSFDKLSGTKPSSTRGFVPRKVPQAEHVVPLVGGVNRVVVCEGVSLHVAVAEEVLGWEGGRDWVWDGVVLFDLINDGVSWLVSIASWSIGYSLDFLKAPEMHLFHRSSNLLYDDDSL